MSEPDLSKRGSPEEQAVRYRELRRQTADPDSRWFLLIKELRALHGFTIFEAEREALGDEALRRWVERQINTQSRCRRIAMAHIKSNGNASLIVRQGENFKIVMPTE